MSVSIGTFAESGYDNGWLIGKQPSDRPALETIPISRGAIGRQISLWWEAINLSVVCHIMMASVRNEGCLSNLLAGMRKRPIVTIQVNFGESGNCQALLIQNKHKGRIA